MDLALYVLIYFVIINLFTFLTFYLDKQKAINRKYRISETTLLKLALIGGSVGAIYGMKTFRHKTNKTSFYVRMYMIIAVQMSIIIFLLYYIFNN